MLPYPTTKSKKLFLLIHAALFQDVFKLIQGLPNLVASYCVPYPEWNHLDYLWGIDAYTLVYPEVMKNIEKYR